MALSQWMDSGEKPFDLGDVDISRMNPFQEQNYLFERSKETLGLLYADTSIDKGDSTGIAAHHSITI